MATLLGLISRLDDRFRLGYVYSCLTCLSGPRRPSSYSAQQSQLRTPAVAYYSVNVRIRRSSRCGQPVVQEDPQLDGDNWRNWTWRFLGCDNDHTWRRRLEKL